MKDKSKPKEIKTEILLEHGSGSFLRDFIRRSVGVGYPNDKAWSELNRMSYVSNSRSSRIMDPGIDITSFATKSEMASIEARLVRVEAIKIKNFEATDVYEVNKRIERLEGKIALFETCLLKQQGKERSTRVFEVIIFIIMLTSSAGLFFYFTV